MKYRSTRSDQSVSLDDALLAGIAPDGGLYVPERLPDFRPDDFAADRDVLSLARRYLEPFFEGSSLAGELPDIVSETFAFELPVIDISDAVGAPVHVLELFHGPTAAFKDVGARFLAACLSRLDLAEPRDLPLTILVATSGDTGGAVAAAFHGRPGIGVVVLFPLGRVSPRQQHQLTCWGDNVVALGVSGSFDDCQALVKQAFRDEALASRFRFSSANSINIGRLLPQSVYYAWSAVEHWRGTGARLNYVIPTGNLGNGLACVLARAAGLPIGDIVFATNANRTVPDYLEQGDYAPRDSIATLASAMDVGDPSNMERLRNLFGEAEALRGAGLSAQSVDDAAIRRQIVRDHARLPFAWCPHSAAAMAAYEALPARERAGRHWCIVATAHPAKFETIVEPLVGRPVPVPDALRALLARPAHFTEIEPGIDELAAALNDTAPGG
jgi:threonine synthase